MGVENEDSSREHSLSRYSMQKIQYAEDTVCRRYSLYCIYCMQQIQYLLQYLLQQYIVVSTTAVVVSTTVSTVVSTAVVYSSIYYSSSIYYYSSIYYCSIYYCSSRYCSIYYSIYCSRYSLQKRMLTYSRKGKYHCKADLLFDWFAFDQTSKSVVHTTQAKQLKANKSNQMSVVQRHLHL